VSEQAKRGEGRAFRFIVAHQTYAHKDWCLIWPFTKVRGYGSFGYLGKRYYAHRYMCELVNGSAPSDVHEAAHSCGESSCVNPHHLSWKLPADNGLDCRSHGTHVRNTDGPGGRITSEQAAEIRALKGVKKLDEIAAEYGVSYSTVSNIWVGRTHSPNRKGPPVWSKEEDAELVDLNDRGHNHKEIAGVIGRPYRAVTMRAHRLGIKSKWTRSNSPADRDSK
jgi:hypothetical protein